MRSTVWRSSPFTDAGLHTTPTFWPSSRATAEQAVDAESDAHRFFVASTSRAGRRSPVRLIMRGARRYTRSNPRPVYRCTNPVGRLIGQHDRSGVPGQPPGGSNLVTPAEAPLGVLGELHVVWWVGIDEIPRLHGHLFDIFAHEAPAGQGGSVGREVAHVNQLPPPEGAV